MVSLNLYIPRDTTQIKFFTASLPLKNDGKGFDDPASEFGAKKVTFAWRSVSLREGK